MSYLLSPAWFALLIVWSAFLPMAGTPESYFSPQNPLYPVWPAMNQINGVWFLVLIYAMLLLPKLVAATLLTARRDLRGLYGGRARFAATMAVEVILAVLYAPILMVQQTGAVLRAVLTRGNGWQPAQRRAVHYSWAQLLRFHGAEVVIGTGLMAAMLLGQLSPWLAPVALSLTFAPILSHLSGLRVTSARFAPLRLETPVSLRRPRIAETARLERARLSALLDAPEPAAIAAE